jgi:hypothetical protein
MTQTLYAHMNKIKIKKKKKSAFFFSFFLVGLWFELRASHLQYRCFTSSAISPVHFALVILEMGSCELFAQAVLEPWSSSSQLPSS